MTAPAVILAEKLVAEYGTASPEKRRAFDRCQPGRYAASVNLIDVWVSHERRCPRPTGQMDDAARDDLAAWGSGSGNARQVSAAE